MKGYVELSSLGMVQVFDNRYYQHQLWEPKKGDYYVIGRSMQPHNLCKVVEVTDKKIFTIMLPHTDDVSDWDKETFLNDFGTNRLHVPEWMFNYPEHFEPIKAN